MAFVIISLVLILLAGIFLFINRPEFGKTPAGETLKKVQRSPNYNKGSFQNINHTPALTEGVSYTRVMKEFFTAKTLDKIPPKQLPAQKTDLLSLDPTQNILVWFGHSSYFMQIDGKKILVDPVFSGNASPLPGTMKSFPGSDVYTTDDIPEIDYLFITHDHWDHLDHKTMTRLRKKIRMIFTGLGVKDHLLHWGFQNTIIHENDWNDVIVPEHGFKIIAAPARHFSGRRFKRNTSLWLSFILLTPSLKLYLGGDSGYDGHFLDIGNQYGPFDLAILECGQYNKNWKYIHMMPEEVAQAAEDLRAEHTVLVHWAKFPLAQHAWNEPPARAVAEGERKGKSILTPMIGQAVLLHEPTKDNRKWWVEI
ncbi:MAG TPA: MBL fold metallo-hydrolase [Chitinophagaceae bacterium]|nr:MBL fold metallo-hydrolase [Chitinophagaceae bacterium]